MSEAIRGRDCGMSSPIEALSRMSLAPSGTLQAVELLHAHLRPHARAQGVDRRSDPAASRHARRSSRCRLRDPAPARRSGGSSRPSRRARSRRRRAPAPDAGVLASTSLMPGATRPRSISAANGTRGASRAVMKAASAGSGSGSTAAMRSLGRCGVVGITLDADEAPAQPARHRAGRAGAAERVEHEVVRPRRREDDAREQRLRLLRRVQLLAVAALEPLLAGAQRDQPVGAHLDVVVAGFQRLVVERVVPLARHRAPPRSGSRAHW